MSLARLVRAEFVKAITMRSVWITLAAACLVPPVLALAAGLSFNGADARWATFPVESHGFETAGFGQPLVILLAALIVGSEFMDGQLRTSLMVVPRRLKLFAAKFTVVVLLSLAVALVAIPLAVVIKHTVLGEHGLPISEYTARMAWNLLGVVVNYVLIGVIAGGFTLITRSITATLVVLVPLVLGLTISLLGVAPFLKYLPDLAGIQLLTDYPGVGLLDPLPGALVMLAWTVAIAFSAALIFRRRDVG